MTGSVGDFAEGMWRVNAAVGETAEVPLDSHCFGRNGTPSGALEQGMQARMANLIHPPSDVLLNVIPPQVRDGWRRNPTKELVRRLQVLCACGPKPSGKTEKIRLMRRRAERSAWDTYVYCAFACGLFEGQKGRDLRGRLASKDPESFRSAKAECLACWCLAGRLGFTVSAYAPGRNKKMLDMRAVIDNMDIGLEVKAPCRERPSQGQAWDGGDEDVIAQCLDAANRQFAEDVANILVLVPQLRTPISVDRAQLVSALYGEEKITRLIDMTTGGPVGDVATKFFPEGKFLRRRQPSGALVKRNGMPGFTRISAVIVIEEEMRDQYPHPITTLGRKIGEGACDGSIQDAWGCQLDLHYGSDNYCWIDHAILVAHNPYARRPLNPQSFREYVQFMEVGDGYGWSDGESL